MRIGLLRTQVPFVSGGAERHSARLARALQEFGHDAVEITLPFKWYPGKSLVDNIIAAKLIDVSDYEGVPIDLAIGLKFPAYLMRHPNKVYWIIHQHRQAYDQWDSGTSDLLHEPDGDAIRHLIRIEDRDAFAETSQAIYANSKNVSNRLGKYLQQAAIPLYHPPPLEHMLRQGNCGDYLLVPGRINASKRLDLILHALALMQNPPRVVVAGTYENRNYFERLVKLARELGIERHVEWHGAVTDPTLVRLYADARAVVFVPLDEDYGYISLEAMLSGKAVVTVSDAGGPLEFVQHGTTGYICKPTPSALAHAFVELMSDKNRAEKLGANGLARYRSLNITWDFVVEQLVGATGRKEGEARSTGRHSDGRSHVVTTAPRAVEALAAAVQAPLSCRSSFQSINEVFDAYDFGEVAGASDTDSNNDGLVSYLKTHWRRYLTTLNFIQELDAVEVLNVGIFPPFVFEAMLVDVAPQTNFKGVWEGPRPLQRKVVGRSSQYRSFDLKLHVSNIEKDYLGFPDAGFDLVLGMEILEHLALDPFFFVCEAARVLRPGGHILLTTPNVGSHRGVWKTLNGMSPYSYGVFVPTGGVYGRHNREYTPKEVEVLCTAAGFETVHLGTYDVYDDSVDPATAELLVQRGDDLRLRGETIFYLGRRIGPPSSSPPQFYFGRPEKLSGQIDVRKRENDPGVLDVLITNTSRSWWASGGVYATQLSIEWSNGAGDLVHHGIVVPLNDSVAPGGQTSVVFLADDADEPCGGHVTIGLSQAGVGNFIGAGRSNSVTLPCSEATFLSMARQSRMSAPR